MANPHLFLQKDNLIQINNTNQNREIRKKLRFHVAFNENSSILYDPLSMESYRIPQNLAKYLSKYESAEDLNKLPNSFIQNTEQIIKTIFSESSRSLNEKCTSRNIANLVINISQNCNLHCSYCYAEDLNKAKAVMNTDTAEKVLQKILPLSGNGLESIKFLGGEPTINFHAIEYVVKRTKELCYKMGLELPSFVIVTNGTLLSDLQMKFLKDNEFYVMVSLDGPKTVHDALRPKYDGSGSFDEVKNTIKHMVDMRINIGIESTYTIKHQELGITPLQMVKFFESLGVHQFSIQPVQGIWHGVDPIEHIETISKEYRKMVRYLIYSLITDNPSILLNTRSVLEGFSDPGSKGYICGAGRNFLAVNYDGLVFPCYLLESLDTYMGNVLEENWPTEKFYKVSEKFWDMSKDANPVCSKCWAKEMCSSCYGSSFQISKNLEKPPLWHCTFSKAQIEEILLCLSEIQKDPNKWIQLMNGFHKVHVCTMPD